MLAYFSCVNCVENYARVLRCVRCVRLKWTIKVVVPQPQVHRAALMSVSLALSQTPVYTARPRYGASASRGVPVYVPAFTGTHCAYPRRDGQAELISMSVCRM